MQVRERFLNVGDSQVQDLMSTGLTLRYTEL